jgi:hypothetical protein
LAKKRRKRERAELLTIIALASRGKPDKLEKLIKDLEQD